MKTNKTTNKIISSMEDQYRILFESNRDSITIFRIDSEGNVGNIIEANPATTSLFGYTKEELLTMSIEDIEIVSEKKRKSRIATLISKGKLDFETIIKNKKGDHRIVEIETIVINYLNEPAVMNITRDITERKQSEDNIRKVQENLTTILEAIPDLLFEVDLKGRIYHYQAHRQDLLILPSDQIIGKYLKDFMPAEVSEICFSALKEANENGWSLGKQYSLQLPHGKHWFELSVSPIKDKKLSDKRFIMLARDINDRKLAEEKVIASVHLLNQTQTIANLGSYSLDFTTGKWTSTSILDNIFGIDANFARTIDGWKSIIHPEWQTIMDDYLNNEVIGKNKNFNKEYKIIKNDTKEERWIHGMGEIILNKQNQPLHLIGSILDITDKKLAEEKIKESSEKFQNLVNSTGGIVWEADARTLIFNYVSQEAERLLGHSTEEWYTEGFWANHLHPDDKDKTITFCVDQTNQMIAHDFKYRFRAKDGKYVWLKDVVNVVVEDGKPRWLRGVMFDISKQEEIIESLRESEEKYRGLVENSPDGIVIYVANKITYANSEALRIIKAKNFEQIIGKSVLDFIHPDSLESVTQRMKEVVMDSFASQIVEEKLISFTGETVYVEIKAIPTTYEHQEGVQVIIHDITLRKQTSLELNKINRVHALISQINNLIIRTRNQEELFQEICNIAVDFGKFRMSWIGLVNDDDKILTGAFAGHEAGYFNNNKITTNLDELEGRGPTGIAIQEARTVICNDITNDPMMKPWRKDALERGYFSVISIPITVRKKIIGAFNLYSEESNFFSSEEEISLLEKIMINISFALEKIQIEKDRKKTEEKIRQLSQAVEQSPVTIVITNTNGEIEYANPKFVETTGYAIDEVLGENPRVLKSGYSSQKEYKELWKTISNGNEWHGEFKNKRKDGSLYWESATISPIVNNEGKTTHYIAIKEDITQRKKAEKELIKSKERAEESDRLKLAFLANMSHEIRTPMNGILGFTELLKEQNLSGEVQQEYINIIKKSGKRMLNIINDIINISKVESGQIEVTTSETNVNEQIDYLHTFFKPETLQKNISINLIKELSPEDTFVITDREKLYAILTNLIKNAIKFTNEGSIDFGCQKKGDYLEFFVKDTGLGISKSQKKIIFERFRQANDTISRSHEGSGLGLAISKAYVEMLGGKIWVKSKQGKGSTFYFTIPFHTKNEFKEKIVVKKQISDVNDENNVKDLKVLIVEDDAISKLLITIAVKPYCKKILKVSTGIEAVETCRNNPDIDLVMMDINMPEMDGHEAAREIRKFNKDIVIIAQTANGMQSDRDKAIAEGCTDYISKPINISTLGGLIQKYFKK
jgi:PAS domain S-box-containing protein